MIRPYLFMAGEYNVTMHAVFELEEWHHTMVAHQLEAGPGGLVNKRFNQSIDGIVYFARSEDYQRELSNLQAIKASGVPCWPPVDVLIRMSDRHLVMAECREAELTTDWCYGVDGKENGLFDIHHDYFPMVLKYGQCHQGEGKYKLYNTEEGWANLPKWEGLATVEPFYEGLSVRILIIGEHVFGVQYHNDQSWIKNSLGCEYDDWTPVPGIVEHAQKVKNHFGLEITGVDYVVEPDGKFHFLEINQYPGLHINDESVKVAREFLVGKMKSISRKEPK